MTCDRHTYDMIQVARETEFLEYMVQSESTLYYNDTTLSGIVT